MEHWEVILFFLVIAFLYSSVGFGGGSSYLALLAMYNLPYQEIRLTALVCNVIVVTGGMYIYIRNGQANWRKIIPITIFSIPMAYFGGMLKISQGTFFILLGFTLIAAAVLLWIGTGISSRKEATAYPKTAIIKNGFLGGTIGFISGMVGIGGGIFLSPVLNLMKWDTAKKIAATSSFFILANSIAGISGQLLHITDRINGYRVFYLCLAVFAGGQLGARMSLNWNPLVIKRVTAILVFAAGINVLLKYWKHVL